MFENFQNIPTSYTPNNYQNKITDNTSVQSVSPNKPYEIKNALGEVTGYFWYYGNSIDLVFDIQGEYTTPVSYITVEDYLSQFSIVATLFDFKWNIVHQQKLSLNGTQVTLSIDTELSSKLVKGKYRIQLVAINEEARCSETIFSADSCILEVR